VEKIIVKEVQVPFDVYVDNIVVKEVVQEIEIERFVVKEVLSSCKLMCTRLCLYIEVLHLSALGAVPSLTVDTKGIWNH
jgi:hypothetical protein